MAAVLKTARGRELPRGFESHTLRSSPAQTPADLRRRTADLISSSRRRVQLYSIRSGPVRVAVPNTCPSASLAATSEGGRGAARQSGGGRRCLSTGPSPRTRRAIAPTVRGCRAKARGRSPRRGMSWACLSASRQRGLVRLPRSPNPEVRSLSCRSPGKGSRGGGAGPGGRWLGLDPSPAAAGGAACRDPRPPLVPVVA
jgi:hypothetical protein